MKILLFGEQNSGKDTVAAMLKARVESQSYGPVEIAALADPMKRVTQKLFGCTDEQLWGPSENRNAHTIPPSHPLTAHFGELDLNVYHTLQSWVENDVRVRTRRGARGEQHDPLLGLEGWIRTLRGYSGANDGKNVGLSPRKVLQTLGTEWGRSVDPEIWIKAGARTADALLNGGKAYKRAVGLCDAPGYNAGSVVITDGRFRNELVGLKQRGFKVVQIVDTSKSRQNDPAPKHASEMEQQTIPAHWFDVRLHNSKDGLERLGNQVTDLMFYLYRGGKTIF